MPTEATIEVIASFELGGQRFEAVRVHQESEERVLGDEAITRADAAPGGKAVRSDEDWKFVYEHRGELPPTLNDFWLATARPDPGDPRGVSCLDRDGRGWCGHWGGLDGGWYRDGLVLRRRTA